MATRNRNSKEVTLDPITGKPIEDSRLLPLVIGSEEEAVETGDEISGPEETRPENPPRSANGTLLRVVVDADDSVDDLVDTLRGAWRNARRDRGLDG